MDSSHRRLGTRLGVLVGNNGYEEKALKIHLFILILPTGQSMLKHGRLVDLQI